MKNQPITNPSSYGQMADPSMFTCIQPSQLVDVVQELLERHYSVSDIKAILGENFLRVLEQHQNTTKIQNNNL